MATATVFNNAGAILSLTALLAQLNAGSGAGKIQIFTGAPPASCETADTGTLLVTCTFSATAFLTPVDNSAGGATATADTITGGTAGNTGTAGYFRCKPGTSSSTNAVIQGTVGTSAADMIVNATLVTAGDMFNVSAYTVTQPDGSGVD